MIRWQLFVFALATQLGFAGCGSEPGAASVSGGPGATGDEDTRPAPGRDGASSRRADAAPAPGAQDDGGVADPDPGADAASSRADAPGTDAVRRDAASRRDAPPPVVFIDPGDAGLLGPTRCRGSNLPVCLDFETSGLDPDWRRTEYPVLATGTQITIDATRAARGNRSLHVAGAGAVTRMIATARLPPGANLWGRAFFYFSARPKTHGVLVRATGKNELGNEASYSMDVFTGRFTGDYIQLSPFVEKPAECNPAYAGGQCNTDDPLVPSGRWVCMEWQLDAADGKGTQIFRDGQPIKLIVYAGTWPKIGAFSRLEVGLQLYSDGDPMDVWIDEFAVDTRRIGCDG